MLVPKKNRVAIYTYLMTEGCIVIKDDPSISRPIKIGADETTVVVPNIEVIKVLQSLCSSEYVKKTYSWRHFYYFLTDKGIEYLRNYLHLPAEAVPATLVPNKNIMQREERPFGNRRNGERTFRNKRNFRSQRSEEPVATQA